MKREFFISAVILLLASTAGRAQFVTSGTDRGSTRWRSVESASWKIVYPAGADSLAREYARSLEGWRQAVGGSIGIAPNGNYRTKMPVLLHTQNAISNGMVTWLPRRMELYTTPERTAPDPYPWIEQLAVHESRHVAQMQVAAGMEWKAFNALSGELWTGAFSALYGGPAFLEGDAVVAETALSSSGRARTADFLEFMRASTLEGRHRNWWQWRYGSLNKYTPDYYKAGYALIAGMRNVYADSLFTQRFYDRLRRKWMPYENLKKTMGAVSGFGFGRTWKAIDGNLTEMWTSEAEGRAPYTDSELIGKTPRRYVSYSRLTLAPDGVYAVRNGINEASTLVFLPFAEDGLSGKEKTICPFSSAIGMMCYSAPSGRLFWSETVPDLRWEQNSCSVIRYIDRKGIKKTLIKGRMLFNPSANPDKPEIAAVEQSGDGRSRIVIFDAIDGRDLSSFAVPAGMQVTETVWADGRIFASVLTENGLGLRSLPDFKGLLEDSHVKIHSLSSDGSRIFFTSDRGGSNEVYSIPVEGGNPVQLTSSLVGARGGIMAPGGLVFTSVSTKGRLPYFCPSDSLRSEEVDWSVRHKWVWEDRISEQEKAIMKVKGIAEPSPEVEVSEPAHYGKAAHLLHVHSWLPLYVNPDEVAAASVETVSQSSWLGATAFFQNLLGTFHGSAGMILLPSIFNAPYAGASAQFTYEGLFPVFEAGFKIGEKYASDGWSTFRDGSVLPSGESHDLAFSSNFRTYVPLNLSSGGWNRGAIISASLNVSNDLEGVTVLRTPDEEFEEKASGSIAAAPDGKRRTFGKATVAARFYTMRPIPSSCIYPKLGIGIEAGYRMFPWMKDLAAPIGYIHAYGYLPGLWKTHGLRLSYTAERQEGGKVKSMAANYIPRGMSGIKGFREYLADYPERSIFSADYVFPFWSIESDRLCSFAYVRNMEATLHWDYSLFSGLRVSGDYGGGDIASVGADLCFVLANFAWIPYDTRIGVSWNHCWGTSLRDTFGFILNIGL